MSGVVEGKPVVPRSWWLPLLTAMCVLAATTVLANSLRLRERHHIQHMTDMATSAM